MIPRVRLVYVQGLAAAHEELRRPREVDLTTDGEHLIVVPPASGRPLVRMPLAAVTLLGVVPAPRPGPPGRSATRCTPTARPSRSARG
jgi:hypothetical protein